MSTCLSGFDFIRQETVNVLENAVIWFQEVNPRQHVEEQVALK